MSRFCERYIQLIPMPLCDPLFQSIQSGLVKCSGLMTSLLCTGFAVSTYSGLMTCSGLTIHLFCKIPIIDLSHQVYNEQIL